jgi:hypothetical protein
MIKSIMKKIKIEPVQADENKQIKVMMEKAMKQIEDPLKSLFGLRYKQFYYVLLIIVFFIIFSIAIFSIIQKFLSLTF